MERLYYVESEHETAETSDRMEAARIAAEWAKRGYKVDTVIVDEASAREDDATQAARGTRRPENSAGTLAAHRSGTG